MLLMLVVRGGWGCGWYYNCGLLVRISSPTFLAQSASVIFAMVCDNKFKTSQSPKQKKLNGDFYLLLHCCTQYKLEIWVSHSCTRSSWCFYFFLSYIQSISFTSFFLIFRAYLRSCSINVGKSFLRSPGICFLLWASVNQNYFDFI